MLVASLASLLFLAVPPASSAGAQPAAPAVALQQGPAASPQLQKARQEMEKLAFLAGRWEGTATVMAPDGQRQIRQSEEIRFKVGDTVLLIEGTGREGEGADARVVFEALAVIAWDPQTNGYAMRAFTERGHVNPKVVVGENELTWSFDTPDGAGKVRYQITLDEQGRWREIGEFSRDGGETWMKTIDMTLTRVPEPT